VANRPGRRAPTRALHGVAQPGWLPYFPARASTSGAIDSIERLGKV
jgi:hypothetical protein